MKPEKLREIEREQDEHLACHDLRLESLEKQLSAVQTWLNLECQPNPEGRFILESSLPGVIADGGTMAINHCNESAAMATVAVSATDKRADSICERMDLLQNLVSSVKGLVLNLNERLEALETAGADIQRNSDSCRVCSADMQATHAPWCEERDGTPIAERDRFRIFADSILARLEALESRNPA